MAVLGSLFHVAAFSIYLVSWVYDVFILRIPGVSKWEKIYFLTFWNMTIQLMFWGACVFWSKKKKATLDFLFAAIVFPLALETSFAYWGIYAVDPDLLAPPEVRALIPSWLDHCTHTLPIVTVLLDSLLVTRCFPTRGRCLKTLLTFAGVYLAWIHFIAYYWGVWVYPVLEVLDLPYRLGFLLALLLLMSGFYMTGEFCNSCCSGQQQKKHDH